MARRRSPVVLQLGQSQVALEVLDAGSHDAEGLVTQLFDDSVVPGSGSLPRDRRDALVDLAAQQLVARGSFTWRRSSSAWSTPSATATRSRPASAQR
ncbi:hypothetical protein BWI15_30955 [Kribbella sp. ALI-6-A]|nr:hypothetical protein BWI15_30955 [Kribbella sp. ALI-6-A]